MKKRIPIKLHAVNVVEMVTDDCVIEGIRSFNTTPKGIKAAEKLFAKLIHENTLNDKGEETVDQEEIDRAIEDGYFEEGTWKVALQWS